MYFVYILKSLKDGRFYVGCTMNLKNRVAAHNAGKTRLLRNCRPLQLVYSEQYDNQQRAYAREKQIKMYKGGEAFKKLISGGVA